MTTSVIVYLTVNPDNPPGPNAFAFLDNVYLPVGSTNLLDVQFVETIGPAVPPTPDFYGYSYFITDVVYLQPAVPEPTTFALMALGFAILFLIRRRPPGLPGTGAAPRLAP